MAVTGDLGSGITGVLTHPVMDTRIREVQHLRNVLYHLISKDVGSIGGVQAQDSGGKDYIQLRRYTTARDFIAGGRAEGEDVRLPGTTTRAWASLYPKQIMGSIGWTHERLEFIETERGLADLITGDFMEHISAVQGLLNMCWAGDGTGRLARVSAYSATSATVGTVTVDNDQADFGWNLCDHMFNGMLVDIYTVADITGGAAWTRKALECVVSGINRSAGTFTITARTDSGSNAISGSAIDPDGDGNPANTDYVFISGAARLDSSYQFDEWGLPMGIHAIVDDDQDTGNEFTESGNLYNHSWHGSTIQGLSRTTAANSMFRSTVVRAGDNSRGGTDGTALTTDMNDIDTALDPLYQTGTTPNPTNLIALCNSPTKRWWATTANNEQNGFQNVDDGRVVPGMILNGYRSEAAGGQIIPVVTMPTMANGTIIFLDVGQLSFWEPNPLGPFLYGGKTQFESPGTRNLFYERWSRYLGNLAFARSDTSTRIEDISIT